MIIHQMLAQNQSGSAAISLGDLDPEMSICNLRKKYLGHDSKIIQAFLSFKSSREQDYIAAKEQINEDVIQILISQPVLSARVIFVAQKFKLHEIYQKVCSPSNPIFSRYSRLTGQYKNRYLVDIGHIRKKETSFSLTFSCQYENYKFYANGDIQVLHRKKKNYDYLEDRHDYIQWMFPNHYHSMFNSKSYPMSYLEVELFKSSYQLGVKLLQSINIFLDFMGLELSKDYQFTIISEKRLKDVLLFNTHNHLRLRRILACLSITGFRPIALKLIQLLNWIVSNCKTYGRLKRIFEREWQIYGQKNKEEALKLCFHTEDQFPQPHAVVKQHFNGQFNKQIIANKQIFTSKPSSGPKMSNFDSSSSSSSSSSSNQHSQKHENKQKPEQVIENKQKPEQIEKIPVLPIPGQEKFTTNMEQQEKIIEQAQNKPKQDRQDRESEMVDESNAIGTVEAQQVQKKQQESVISPPAEN